MTVNHEPALAGDDQGSMAYLVLICFIATLGGLLFGYDTAVISGAISFLEGHFALDATMTGWAAACVLLGCAVGSVGAGPLNDGAHWRQVLGLLMVSILSLALTMALRGLAVADSAFGRSVLLSLQGFTAFLFVVTAISGVALFIHGRKKALVFAALLFLGSSLGTALARSLGEFVVYRIAAGVAVGVAAVTSPMYIAEISPAKIRGRMVSLNQFAIIFGMLVVYFVNYFIAGLGDRAWNENVGWRWMFASGDFPSIALLLSLFWVPESPRWLLKQARVDEAYHVLSRISGSHAASKQIVTIKDALRHEGESVWQLLAPGMRFVLVMGVVLAVLQQVTGINVILYFAPEIFRRVAGEAADTALLQTVLVGAVNLSFTIVAIWTVDWLGRKPLMVFGYCGMGISLLAVGLAAHWQRTGNWILLFMLAYIASFALSVGPVTWVILSEIFPTKIRGRAMAIATVCLWIANYVISQTFPMMMDEDSWLVARFHHAFPFYVYGGFCVLAILFMLAFVPETKGRTLEEIERGWGEEGSL